VGLRKSQYLGAIMSKDLYQEYLILSAISNGASTLEEISHLSGGIYPTELKELLEVLLLNKQIQLSINGYEIVKTNMNSNNKLSSIDVITSPTIKLPEPHPQDYDWRFHHSTVEIIVDMLLDKFCYPGASVMLLGSPSILTKLIGLVNPPYTILLDYSENMINYLKENCQSKLIELVTHDVLCGHLWENRQLVDVAICDPPWYTEYYSAFLLQAAYTTKIGGAIIISFMPINTRPNAISDRWKILCDAQALGLHLEKIEPNVMVYETPIFERMSLSVSNIPINSDWRKGDLVVFRKVNNLPIRTINDFLESINYLKTDNSRWLEFLLGLFKIKLRGPFIDPEIEPSLVSIEKQDILPTVSRRYQGREKVDLWLWDNRVFAVKGKAAFATALCELTKNPVPISFPIVDKTKKEIATTYLHEILNDVLPLKKIA
jgi:hypothetical protein